jgi:predicted RNA-binding protein with PUA-like domain
VISPDMPPAAAVAASRWLVKSEPETFSWADQMRNGVEPWTGVRNALAAKHLRGMRKGDQAFFYHSVTGKEIVGIVEVVREAYPDPTDDTGRGWVSVDVKAVAPLPKPVTLAAIKAEPALADLALVRQGQLSVMPVAEAHWRTICALGGWPAATDQG